MVQIQLPHPISLTMEGKTGYDCDFGHCIYNDWDSCGREQFHLDLEYGSRVDLEQGYGPVKVVGSPHTSSYVNG